MYTTVEITNNRYSLIKNTTDFSLIKLRKEIAPVSDILAYCLMPNHFHFLVHVNEASCKPKQIGSLNSTELQNGFRVLQSSYANAINKQSSRTGSVFQQKTKFKLLNDGAGNHSYSDTYAEVCFHYIHQNPLKAGLVNKLEDWDFSSFSEYQSTGSTLCNKDLAFKLLDIKQEQLYKISYDAIKPELLDKLF
jgi:putative transposase